MTTKNLIQKTFFVSSLFICGSINMWSQTNHNFRNYKTQQIENESLKNEKVATRKNAIEEKVASYIFKGGVKKKTIPVVFHQYINTNKEKLSRKEILNQVKALNTHFKNDNEKLSINFCLGFKKEKLGVEYYRNLSDTINTSFWNSNEFINIVIKTLPDTTAGYAKMPWDNNQSQAIVINRSFFGVNETPRFDEFRTGATLTHLVANTLGIYDLWYHGGQDDKVEDTPLHNAANHGVPGEGHINTIDGEEEMVHNFMDNSNDSTLTEFTFGQFKRMHAILEVEKADLFNNKNTKCDCEEEEEEFEQETIKKNIKMTLAPNPASSFTNIILSEELENVTITIYSFTGELIKTFTSSTARRVKVDTRDLLNGTYAVTITDGNTTLTKKLTITNN